MTRYLLDTDTCIWVLRLRDPVLSRVRGTSPDDLVIATMTEAELMFGALNSRDAERNLERLDVFLAAPFEVIPFDREAARRHAELRLALKRRPIGERDLIIASTASAHGLTVVTS
ncbi:MAG: type II toxin-antitoxin system VapC family toxin, partial [Longimicrobiales bacterium]